MGIEYLAVAIAVIGGLAGVFGDTWDSKNKKLKRTGWATIAVVLCAGIVSIIQLANIATENRRHSERELKLSYQALIDVHGPLAMFLGSLNPDRTVDEQFDARFPPPLRENYYAQLHNEEVSFVEISDWLGTPIDTTQRSGAPDPYAHTKLLADRYRLLQSKLDESITVFGPHVSDEVLDHLIGLRTHSLFRREKMEQLRSDRGECRGGIEKVTRDMANDPENIRKCKRALKIRLMLLFEDPFPTPSFTPGMKQHHEAHCQKIGVQIPHCGWGARI